MTFIGRLRRLAGRGKHRDGDASFLEAPRPLSLSAREEAESLARWRAAEQGRRRPDAPSLGELALVAGFAGSFVGLGQAQRAGWLGDAEDETARALASLRDVPVELPRDLRLDRDVAAVLAEEARATGATIMGPFPVAAGGVPGGVDPWRVEPETTWRAAPEALPAPPAAAAPSPAAAPEIVVAVGPARDAGREDAAQRPAAEPRAIPDPSAAERAPPLVAGGGPDRAPAPAEPALLAAAPEPAPDPGRNGPAERAMLLDTSPAAVPVADTVPEARTAPILGDAAPRDGWDAPTPAAPPVIVAEAAPSPPSLPDPPPTVVAGPAASPVDAAPGPVPPGRAVAEGAADTGRDGAPPGLAVAEAVQARNEARRDDGPASTAGDERAEPPGLAVAAAAQARDEDGPATAAADDRPDPPGLAVAEAARDREVREAGRAADPAVTGEDRDLLAATLRDLDGPGPSEGATAPGRSIAAARQADAGRDLDDLPEVALLPQPQYASLADLLG